MTRKRRTQAARALVRPGQRRSSTCSCPCLCCGRSTAVAATAGFEEGSWPLRRKRVVGRRDWGRVRGGGGYFSALVLSSGEMDVMCATWRTYKEKRLCGARARKRMTPLQLKGTPLSVGFKI